MLHMSSTVANEPDFDPHQEKAMRAVRIMLGYAASYEREGEHEVAHAIGARAANLLAGVLHRDALSEEQRRYPLHRGRRYFTFRRPTS